jgi:hypothetical protein
MNVQSFPEHVSRVRLRMFNLHLNGVGTHDAIDAGWGLPAGSVHLTDRKLILAGTPCDAPLFQPAVRKAAAATGADVLLADHGLGPAPLNQAEFSVLVHMSGEPFLFEHMVPYAHPCGDHWLVPAGNGPFVALEKDGLRLACEPPFLTFHQRCLGIHAASTAFGQTTQILEAA